MCIKWLKFLYKPPVIIPGNNITNGELRNLLVSKFPDAQIWLSDGDYRLCSPDEIDHILSLDDTAKYAYNPDTFDCDDFSYRLMGNLSVPGYSDLAFGIVWTNVHALNLFIDSNKQIWFIEPQTDTKKVSLENWQGSKVVLVVM
jgi:hypothetical protein